LQRPQYPPVRLIDHGFRTLATEVVLSDPTREQSDVFG
jgi:hypothetical protein